MKYIFLFVFTSVLTACDSSRVFEEYNNMDEAFWHMDSVQKFSFEITNAQQAYNLAATFRNASSYPFSNIYFQYAVTDSLDSVILIQLKEANLFDLKTGEPKGSGLGDMFDHRIPIVDNYTFPGRGVYNIKLQQFMRLDTLPFILSVGARVEYAEE